MERAAQGSGHGSELLEFRECLDSALKHTVWFLGSCVDIRDASQKLKEIFLFLRVPSMILSPENLDPIYALFNE